MSTVEEFDPAKLSIIHFPHPTLRIVAKPVRKMDGLLRETVARMFELMYEHRGVGLAATQVNLPIRLFVMNPTGKQGEGEETVVINPVVSRPRGNEESEEGCLSLPGVHGNVVRSKTIRLTAYSLTGEEIDREFDGFEARIIQHETDHLDGKLFIDRLRESAVLDIAGELDALATDYQSRQRTGEAMSDEAALQTLSFWENRYC